MAWVSPFHDVENPGVYHTCSNCDEASKVEVEHRAPGTGGGRVCSRCHELQRSGDC